MSAGPVLYRSDRRPDFAPFELQPPAIRGFQYTGTLASELAAGRLTPAAAVDLLDDMLAIREMEEMIVRLRSGGYEPLRGYDASVRQRQSQSPQSRQVKLSKQFSARRFSSVVEQPPCKR